MRKFFLLLLLIGSSRFYAEEAGEGAFLSEEIIAKRIHGHLVLKDKDEAYLEACAGIKQFPDSPQIYKAYIYALAEKGHEQEMLLAWKMYQTLAPAQDFRQTIEKMAWGVIEKGAQSTSPMVRIMSILAAFLSQDAKGVSLLAAHLNDSNAFIRKAVVELAGNLRDDMLCKKILSILRQERNWGVYEEAIKSAGSMKISAAAPHLTKILVDDKTSFEEKKGALVSLVNMTDSISHEQLQQLIASPRMGLRLLACELVCHLMLEEEIESIIILTKDSQAQVRSAALQVLGLLGRTPKHQARVLECALQLTSDRDPHVLIPAAWVLTLLDHPRAEGLFKSLLEHHEPTVRVAAAGALTSTGKYGIPLLQHALNASNDPFVRLNAALGLIAQQVEIAKACEILYQGLQEQPQRWMWDEFGIFKALAPSTLTHDDAIPRYPESVDQATRLEILNTLAIMNSTHAQEAIKNFLKEKVWGISGMASILLLTEGDEAALSIIENLIEDPDQQIRIQAALILALWGRGEKAIRTLQEAYPGASRDLKERILEGLGKVASETSIPFLIDKLETEPFQTLRILAASSLLMCLNH